MLKKTIIPATKKLGKELIKEASPEHKLRVCAYVRVSTDSEEQLESFNAQIGRYKGIIFQVQIEYNPSFSGQKGEGYWMGYVRNETKFQNSGGGWENNNWITFGFSNYHSLKYILKAIKRYLSGESFFIRGEHCLITPDMTEEDIQKIKLENKRMYKEDINDKILALKSQIADLENEYNNIDNIE